MATDALEMRQIYCNTLIELAKKDDRIVVLDADLMKANGTMNFKKEFPERTVDVGIAEANMIGVAAGLSAFGKIPFCASFAPFATRRCFDQIAVSVVFAQQNVKIVGTDPGITAELNGGTHMSFEDMAIMRSLQGMVVFEPTDGEMLAQALPQIAAYKGPVYIRMFRKKATTVFDSSLKFDLFKSVQVKDGKEVTIFASGIMVERAIEAADLLAADGIDARVVNIATWKPIDKEAIIAAAKETGAIVTAENHNKFGGLGSAVAEVVATEYPVPVTMVAIPDVVGEVGKVPFLAEKFGLTTADIVAAARRSILLK